MPDRSPTRRPAAPGSLKPFQFGLGSLFLLTTFCAVFLSILKIFAPLAGYVVVSMAALAAFGLAFLIPIVLVMWAIALAFRLREEHSRRGLHSQRKLSPEPRAERSEVLDS